MRSGYIANTVACLLTAVACLSSSPGQIPLAHHAVNKQSVSKALFAELEELSRVVDIAYCVGEVALGIQKPFECVSRCKDFENFELVTTWNTGPLLSDSCGYIALSHPPSPPRLIVAFRGTYSIANTIADLSTIPQEYKPYPGDEDSVPDPSAPKCDNCTVHTGFYTSWQNTRTEILPHVYKALKDYPTYNLTLVGHSLGGAVAAFAGLELLARGLHPTVTTFGEPKTGNQALADYLNARFNLSNTTIGSDLDNRYRRVTHVTDPVPLLPLEEWGYVPHGGEIFIIKPDLPPAVADVRHCNGNADPACIAGPAPDPDGSFWTVPTRFKLWQIFFAHRDYFWRIGLCVPNPLDFWRGHEMDGWTT